MGTTGGGLWKSTDAGLNWNNISDGFFKSPSIGAIRVYQKTHLQFTLALVPMAFDLM